MEAIRSFLEQLGLAFVPLFVALDVIGNLPVVLSLIERVPVEERETTIQHAILTGAGIGLLFIVVGKGVFLLLGINDSDFLIAGGAIILVLATSDLVIRRREETTSEWAMVGVVPIGTPLLVGPAALTTLLLLSQLYPIHLVLISFLVNLAFAWLAFRQANRLARFLGRGGTAAISKVFDLLLAAIAVKMIREGVVLFVATLGTH